MASQPDGQPPHHYLEHTAKGVTLGLGGVYGLHHSGLSFHQ